jgi:hypothetical protein
MKINLLENQIDIILKSLENYITINDKNKSLIYATYESLLSQKVNNSNSSKCNKNVTINFKKTIYKG